MRAQVVDVELDGDDVVVEAALDDVVDASVVVVTSSGGIGVSCTAQPASRMA